MGRPVGLSGGGPVSRSITVKRASVSRQSTRSSNLAAARCFLKATAPSRRNGHAFCRHDVLTTDLSRIEGLFVIARGSAFTYKDKRVDVRQVGHEQGVR
jgi:adenylate cyclase